MIDTSNRPKLGPYALTRALVPCAIAERWLALHEADQSSHVAYRFPATHDRAEQRRFLAALEAVAPLDNSHILRIEQFAFDQHSRPWVVTPFGGDADGVRTISRLLREKGGQMQPIEAEQAVVQVLEAVRHAHDRSIAHGVITMDDIIVDRRGSLMVELYGVSRFLAGRGRWDGEVARDEVRSVVEIGYQLLTGLRAEDPLIPAGRLIKRLDPAWDAWLAHGLDAARGFDTAADAMDALTGASRSVVSSAVPTSGTVQVALERLRPVRR